jgi:hypothetical protein
VSPVPAPLFGTFDREMLPVLALTVRDGSVRRLDNHNSRKCNAPNSKSVLSGERD